MTVLEAYRAIRDYGARPLRLIVNPVAMGISISGNFWNWRGCWPKEDFYAIFGRQVYWCRTGGRAVEVDLGDWLLHSIQAHDAVNKTKASTPYVPDAFI